MHETGCVTVHAQAKHMRYVKRGADLVADCQASAAGGNLGNLIAPCVCVYVCMYVCVFYLTVGAY